jgi:hypothetical protein
MVGDIIADSRATSPGIRSRAPHSIEYDGEGTTTQSLAGGRGTAVGYGAPAARSDSDAFLLIFAPHRVAAFHRLSRSKPSARRSEMGQEEPFKMRT